MTPSRQTCKVPGFSKSAISYRTCALARHARSVETGFQWSVHRHTKNCRVLDDLDLGLEHNLIITKIFELQHRDRGGELQSGKHCKGDDDYTVVSKGGGYSPERKAKKGDDDYTMVCKLQSQKGGWVDFISLAQDPGLAPNSCSTKYRIPKVDAMMMR